MTQPLSPAEIESLRNLNRARQATSADSAVGNVIVRRWVGLIDGPFVDRLLATIDVRDAHIEALEARLAETEDEPA